MWSRPAEAQDCPSGCVGVEVTPDGTSLGVLQNSTGNVAVFNVRNTGEVLSTYTFTCSVTGNVTCGTVTPASAALDPAEERDVNVTFSAGAVGSGRVTLSASGGGTNTGYYLISVQAAGAPTVALRNHNRDNVERSLCLTAGAGESAAWSCGDLVVTHSMPGYATMGRERTLTLIHNSATAYARPVVAAVVNEPSGIFRPNTVSAELWMGAGGGTMRASASYTSWPSGTGGVRQVALDFNAAGDATGAYPIEFRVQNQYTSSAFQTIVKDTLLIVNRFVDEYGAGFGLAGVEQLFFNQPVGTTLGHILWVGGDGSAKLYRKLNASTWAAALGGFQDTLTLSGGIYTRTLRHGVKVTFSSNGRHKETIARTLQKTAFTWNAAGDRLLSIAVPPNGVAGTSYAFAWDPNNNLDYITDPSGRRLDATFAANDGRLTSLLDPDGNSVVFGWDGDRRIISRRNRRGFTTTYEYSQGLAFGSRVTKVTVPIGRVVGDNTTAVTVFQPWNDKGLATAASGQTAIDTAQAYTTVLGARPNVADDASFWVDRWGAPVKITDAVPATTTLVRGNPTVPALVTRVTFPDGRIDSMRYDTRGNLLTLIDSTTGTSFPLPTATTQYVYASPNTKDSPSKVTDPEGAFTTYLYNTWGLTTQVTAPNTHVTKFAYVTTGSLIGLVKAATELSVAAWDVAQRKEVSDSQHTGFAFNTLGNVVSDTSPMGQVRRFTRDGLQRVSDSYDAAGHRTQFTYDALNRVLQSIQHVEQGGNPGYPADPDFTAPLTTTQHYDIDVMNNVTDPRGVVRSYQYDNASRSIGETDDYGATEVRWLNNAGALDSTKDRLNSVVSHRYDAAGRKIKTYWPARAGTPGDSLLSTYDVMGRQTLAKISWPGTATTTRTYYGTGALRTDVTSSSTPSLLVTQAYYYDKAGKRTAYRLGPANDLVHSDSVTYTYDATSGELRQLTVKWRTVNGASPDDFVRFRWDALGRRDTVAYSNGMVFGLGYDKDGTQRLLCARQGVTAPSPDDVSKFRLVHDTVDADGLIRYTNIANKPVPFNCQTTNNQASYNPTNTYDNRHEVKTRSGDGHTSSYKYDGSGNLTISVRDGSTYSDVTDPNHNRLKWRQNPSATYLLFSYTANGDRLDENPCLTTSCSAPNLDYRQHLYDGLGRNVGFNKSDCIGGGCGIVPNSSCYYDPIGRMMTPCEDVAPNLGFDGENVVRTGSDNSLSDWTFIHGPGTDDPVLGRYTGNNLIAFFVTDGQGRQYAALDRGGVNVTSRTEYTQQGGKYAGGTQNGASFDADRHGSSNVPGLSFFRNRVYDQATGRWTQEDPTGVAGGLNLYQFNGNNPVSNTDPFGLCPNPPGSCVTQYALAGAALGGTLGTALGSVTTAGLAIPLTTGTGMVVGGALGALVGAIVELASPKEGSSGGPGAGKDFTQKVKDEARAESDNTCVFCGKATTREPGPDQSNIDHAVPKSRGGNRTPENAQNTCRDCNLDKSTKTTQEYLGQ
jgi:RHS repeat-associated protein